MRNLNQLVPFITAVREGSFRKAASTLGVSPAAISQHIAQLEQSLGYRLFYRVTRQVRITDEGARLFELLDGPVAQIGHALALAQDIRGETGGVIRIGIATGFGRKIVLPLLEEFRERYPKVRLDILFDYDEIDHTENLDLVIRHGIPTTSRFVFHHLCELTPILVATPGYLSRRGKPMTIADLAHHDLIAFEAESNTPTWRYTDAGTPARSRPSYRALPVPEPAVLVRGHIDTASEIMLSNGGILLAYETLMQDLLASGRIVRILPHIRFCLGDPATDQVFLGLPPQYAAERIRLLAKHLISRIATSE